MMPELLLPVGSPDSLIAAVRSGADAVYMGYGNYNARRSAQNFDDDGFKNAVEYCHISGVKVYLTLNTLVSDGEISGALEVAKNACAAGAEYQYFSSVEAKSDPFDEGLHAVIVRIVAEKQAVSIYNGVYSTDLFGYRAYLIYVRYDGLLIRNGDINSGKCLLLKKRSYFFLREFDQLISVVSKFSMNFFRETMRELFSDTAVSFHKPDTPSASKQIFAWLIISVHCIVSIRKLPISLTVVTVTVLPIDFLS